MTIHHKHKLKPVRRSCQTATRSRLLSHDKKAINEQQNFPTNSVISSITHPLAMSKVEGSSSHQPTKEDAIPGLGVLEEDDEFEEFPIQGKHA